MKCQLKLIIIYLLDLNEIAWYYLFLLISCIYNFNFIIYIIFYKCYKCGEKQILKDFGLFPFYFIILEILFIFFNNFLP